MLKIPENRDLELRATVHSGKMKISNFFGLGFTSIKSDIVLLLGDKALNQPKF